MSNQQDWTVWENRWQVLDNTLKSYSERLPQPGLEPPSIWTKILLMLGLKQPAPRSQPVPRSQTLEHLIKCLKEFAGKHFEWFYDGFRGNSPKLEKSDDYPPEYVFRTILDQAAYDLEVIQRAVEQRVSGSPEMRKTLDIADRLAWQALQPAKDLCLVKEETTVVTYFQKSASIRVIPYAQVALIGIPFTCQDVPRDYLAIPHEIGHYVFWKGKDIRKTLVNFRETLLKQDKLSIAQWCCLQWIEEIFADIYGCLIAGPVIALDFQDLMLEKSKEEFIEDDGEHPTPILRPEIYKKALELGENKLKNWAPKLEENWEEYKAKRTNTSEIVVDETITVKADKAEVHKVKIPLSDAREALNAIVDEIIDKTPKSLKNIHPEWWLNYLDSSGSTVEETNPGPTSAHPTIQSLYKDFGGQLDNLPLDKLEPDPTSYDALEESPRTEGIKEDEWKRVLFAAGWITKWPLSGDI